MLPKALGQSAPGDAIQVATWLQLPCSKPLPRLQLGIILLVEEQQRAAEAVSNTILSSTQNSAVATCLPAAVPVTLRLESQRDHRESSICVSAALLHGLRGLL